MYLLEAIFLNLSDKFIVFLMMIASYSLLGHSLFIFINTPSITLYFVVSPLCVYLILCLVVSFFIWEMKCFYTFSTKSTHFYHRQLQHHLIHQAMTVSTSSLLLRSILNSDTSLCVQFELCFVWRIFDIMRNRFGVRVKINIGFIDLSHIY